jgi:hypothetical protein
MSKNRRVFKTHRDSVIDSLLETMHARNRRHREERLRALGFEGPADDEKRVIIGELLRGAGPIGAPPLSQHTKAFDDPVISWIVVVSSLCTAVFAAWLVLG